MNVKNMEIFENEREILNNITVTSFNTSDIYLNVEIVNKAIKDLIERNKYLETIIDSHKDLEKRIFDEIKILEKDINEYKFINNTECEAYKRIIDELQLLRKIYFNY